MNKPVAMILAGGRGKRMGVLCDSKPKPALPFAGKYRVIDFSLSNCLNSGIQDVAVLTGYQRSYLGNYIKRWHSINAPDKNIPVLEPKNGSYLGTADAVYQNLNYLSKQGADAVLILAADHIYKMDYRKMIDFHRSVGADVTVGVISVPVEQTGNFGNVQTNAENRIVDFIEKPIKPWSRWVSMGIYVFNMLPLCQHLIEDAAQPESIHDFGHVILPKLINRDRVFAYKYDDYWQDIGTPEAYYKTNLELMIDHPVLNLEDNWTIFTGDKNYTEYKLAGNTHIKNSKIGPGCVIKGRVENSILSPGVWVGENAVIKNSVVMANASIGRHTLIINSILDEGVTIGDYCSIGIETAVSYQRSGLTVLGQNTRVSSYSQVTLNGDIVNASKTLRPFFKNWMAEDRPVTV